MSGLMCPKCGRLVVEGFLSDHNAVFHNRPPADSHDKALQVWSKLAQTNFAKPQPLVMSPQDQEMYKLGQSYSREWSIASGMGGKSITDYFQRTMEARIRDDHFTLVMNYLFGPASAAKQEARALHWTDRLPGPRGFPRWCVHYEGTPLQDLCWAYRKLAKAERSLRRTWGDWMAEQWWQLRMPDVVEEARQEWAERFMRRHSIVQHEERSPYVADSRGVGWSPPWLDEDGE